MTTHLDALKELWVRQEVDHSVTESRDIRFCPLSRQRTTHSGYTYAPLCNASPAMLPTAVASALTRLVAFFSSRCTSVGCVLILLYGWWMQTLPSASVATLTRDACTVVNALRGFRSCQFRAYDSATAGSVESLVSHVKPAAELPVTF